MKSFRFALIGHNVTYSKSADIFTAIFEIEKVNGSCTIYNIEPDDFADEFPRISSDDVDGMSVTIPYKNAVIPYLDEIDPIAKAIEAVNSIHFSKSVKYGYNTDCYGFSYPLHKYASLLKNDAALIFGGGGAAKAVVYALYTDYEIKQFTVVGRNEIKLQEFKKSFENQIEFIQIDVLTYSNLVKGLHDKRFAIAVNCTPLGGWNLPDKTVFPDEFDWRTVKLFYDLNYNADNKIIASTKQNESVLDSIDGSMMLVAQAVRSYFLWTGVKTDVNSVYQNVFGTKA